MMLKKLKLKAEDTLLLLNVPLDFRIDVYDVKIIESLAIADVMLIFLSHKHQIKNQFNALKPFLKPKTICWIAYPKKSSGKLTDLTMASEWDELTNIGLRPVAAISLDKNYTALQVKAIDLVKKSDASKSQINDTLFAAYINQDARSVEMPNDLKLWLKDHQEAVSFFQSLSFTNKKEYVVWLLSAKQEKTKLERLEKAKEKLIAKKKNPSEK